MGLKDLFKNKQIKYDIPELEFRIENIRKDAEEKLVSFGLHRMTELLEATNKRPFENQEDLEPLFTKEKDVAGAVNYSFAYAHADQAMSYARGYCRTKMLAQNGMPSGEWNPYDVEAIVLSSIFAGAMHEVVTPVLDLFIPKFKADFKKYYSLYGVITSNDYGRLLNSVKPKNINSLDEIAGWAGETDKVLDSIALYGGILAFKNAYCNNDSIIQLTNTIRIEQGFFDGKIEHDKILKAFDKILAAEDPLALAKETLDKYNQKDKDGKVIRQDDGYSYYQTATAVLERAKSKHGAEHMLPQVKVWYSYVIRTMRKVYLKAIYGDENIAYILDETLEESRPVMANMLARLLREVFDFMFATVDYMESISDTPIKGTRKEENTGWAADGSLELDMTQDFCHLEKVIQKEFLDKGKLIYGARHGHRARYVAQELMVFLLEFACSGVHMLNFDIGTTPEKSDLYSYCPTDVIFAEILRESNFDQFGIGTDA